MKKNDLTKALTGVAISAALLGVAATSSTKADASANYITLSKNSYIYNAQGKRVGKLIRKSGFRHTYYSVKMIHGKKYYRIGKNRYIKAANVKSLSSDRQIRVKRQSAIYTVKGKRNGKLTIKVGTKCYVFGTKKINGHLYYKIGENEYIRASNVELIESASINRNASHNFKQNSNTINHISNNEMPKVNLDANNASFVVGTVNSNSDSNSNSAAINTPASQTNGSSSTSSSTNSQTTTPVEPNKGNQGSQTTTPVEPNKGNQGSQTTTPVEPNKGNQGSQTTTPVEPNKGNQGSQTTTPVEPNKGNQGSQTTTPVEPNKGNQGGQTTTPVEPNKGNQGSQTTTPVEPNKGNQGSQTTTPVEPNKGNQGSQTTTPVEPNKGNQGSQTTTPVEPNKGNQGSQTTTPVEPNKGNQGSQTTTPVEPNKGNQGSQTTTPVEPNKGNQGSQTTTPVEPNKGNQGGQTTTPVEPNKGNQGSQTTTPVEPNKGSNINNGSSSTDKPSTTKPTGSAEIHTPAPKDDDDTSSTPATKPTGSAEIHTPAPKDDDDTSSTPATKSDNNDDGPSVTLDNPSITIGDDDNKDQGHATDNPTITEPVFTMPAGYTQKAMNDYPYTPESFEKAVISGYKLNPYQETNSNDKYTKVDPENLSASQQSELSNYALDLINQARSQIGTGRWEYSTKMQNIANDVAKEYDADNAGIDHDVPAIKRAFAKHGITLNDNVVEDLSSDYTQYYNPMTMDSLKQLIHSGVSDMIFGGGSDTHIREMGHARDLLNDKYYHKDFAVSFSINQAMYGECINVHFICWDDNRTSL